MRHKPLVSQVGVLYMYSTVGCVVVHGVHLTGRSFLTGFMPAVSHSQSIRVILSLHEFNSNFSST